MAGGKKLAAVQKRYDDLVKDAGKELDDLERSSNNFYGPTTGSFGLLLEGIDALSDELITINQPNAGTPIAAANPTIIACLKGIADMKHRACNDSIIYWAAAGRLQPLITQLDSVIKDVDDIVKKKEGKILTQKTLPALQKLSRQLGLARGEWSALVQIGPHKTTHRLLA